MLKWLQRVKRKMGIASSTATATASNGMRATAKVVIIKFVFLLPLPHLIFCLCDPMEWTKWTKNRQRWNEYYYGTNEMARKTEKLSSGLIFPSRSFKSMSYICNAYIYRYIVYFVIRFELLQSLSVWYGTCTQDENISFAFDMVNAACPTITPVSMLHCSYHKNEKWISMFFFFTVKWQRKTNKICVTIIMSSTTGLEKK